MASVAGRPTAPLVLSQEERDYLEQQIGQDQQASRSMRERCGIILRCADGVANKAVAAEMNVHENTVGKWRRRFLKHRVEGLFDEDRPGRPRTIDDAQIVAVIERTLQSTPEDGLHWSIRSMAATTGFSHTTIRRIWAAFGLQPHRSQAFELSSDPQFSDRVCDIVGLYLSPPNRALALSVDESRTRAVLDRERPLPTALPEAPVRRMQARQSTASLLASLDLVAGFVAGKSYRKQGTKEFLEFLKQIDATLAPGLDVHIIMDNYATHKVAAIRSWLARRPRYHLHFTPTSASWFHQVETWLAELTRRLPQHDLGTSAGQIEADIQAFIERHNKHLKAFRWVKEAGEARSPAKRFRQDVKHISYPDL